jgi:hypothetical protein
MATPGFNAESSLSKTNESYEMIGTLHRPAKGAEIVAQSCCYWGCIIYEGQEHCTWYCPKDCGPYKPPHYLPHSP